ncbi:MAG: hypothetical protein H7831_14185 [Magnetococcus sp. WYHC-3]
MEGKIDIEGAFFIKRGSHLKEQKCPFVDDDKADPMAPSPWCGDWCPHFQEPYKTNITLTCGAGVTWEFTKFADERG